MKRIKNLLVVLILLLGLFLIDDLAGEAMAAPQSQTSVTLWLEPATVEGPAGGQVNVALMADNASDVAGIQLEITFDNQVVQASSITPGNLPAGTFFQGNLNGGDGPVVIAVAAASAFGPANDTLTLADLTFDLVGDPGGATDLLLGAALVSDANTQPLDFTLSHGEITIKPVDGVDLEIKKDDDFDPVLIGSDLTYTLEVKNNSVSEAATGVSVADLLPAEVTFVSAVAGQGNYDEVSGEWTVGTLTPGQSEVLTIVASVNGDVANGTTISNTATVTGDQNDPDTSNNADTETTQASDVPTPGLAFPAGPIRLESIGSSAIITVSGQDIPADVDGVQLNLQFPIDLFDVSTPGCVGAFQGGLTVGPTLLGDNSGVLIGCFFLSGTVSASDADVMTFELSRIGDFSDSQLVTFGLIGPSQSQYSAGGTPIIPTVSNDLTVVSGVTIMGQVELELCPNPCQFHALGLVTVNGQPTDANGHWEFPDIPPGTFPLTAAAPGHLDAVLSDLEVGSEDVTVPTTNLIAGDVDGNGFVNINDITAAVGKFGEVTADCQLAGGSGQLTPDLNCNGLVEINDITGTAASFGEGSPQPW